jgi:hypothetical protein
MEGIENYIRNSRATALKPFDSFARDEDFMEVTDWYNGEGVDVFIQSVTGEQRFSLTWGEWEALKALLKESYDDEEE